MYMILVAIVCMTVCLSALLISRYMLPFTVTKEVIRQWLVEQTAKVNKSATKNDTRKLSPSNSQ